MVSEFGFHVRVHSVHLYHGSLRKQRHRPQGISLKSTNHSLIHSVALDDGVYEP